MKKSKIFPAILGFLMALSMVLSACAGEETPTTPTIATTPSPTAAAPTPTATTPSSTATTAAPTQANWWDKFGEPEYGGTIVTVKPVVVPVFDPYQGGYPCWQPWLKRLLAFDWALDRKVWSFSYHFAPLEYHKGHLAESWEQPDPQSMVFHIRKGIKWQDKPPVNGREFTAYDVQYHYDRILGTGSGYDKPGPFSGWISHVEKVTATDDYTVVFKFKEAGTAGVLQITDWTTLNFFVPREWVEQGDLSNWENVVGTGPWILTDFVSGSSMTVTRNKNYWDYDERHTENQLPYADTLKAFAITDAATKIAALRTGKIDILAGLDWQHAGALQRTNPDLQVIKTAASGSLGIQMRCDHAPFTDIKVRKALQMAIDLKTIAKTHFGGMVDGIPAGLVLRDFNGYGFFYEEWPQELKDEYGYNLTKAKQLLAEAGYPNGFKTNAITTSPMFDLDLLQIIKSYFMDIGVDMEIKVYDTASYFAYASSGKHDQMAVYGATKASGPAKLIGTFLATNKSDNWCGISDAGYDAIVEKFNNAATMSEAAQYLREADRYYLEKHWAIATLPAPYLCCSPAISERIQRRDNASELERLVSPHSSLGRPGPEEIYGTLNFLLADGRKYCY
jgi:peptide/nickel transport system substrate-binding protein